MKWLLSITVLALLVMSCSDSGTSPEFRSFNLKFSYGVNARNVLNTFQDTYTKDLIMDGTTTISFTLPDSQLQRISSKMSEINFFNYPDTFVVPTGDTVGIVTPHSTYIFHVVNNSEVKDLYWSDSIIIQKRAAVKLRELITLIEDIISFNPKYSQLPLARGAYL
jgi:hypothetical protein